MSGLISFGKPSRPQNATRKVQHWLSTGKAVTNDGTVVLDVSWVDGVNGILRAEEVECNIPGCAPIETLVSFLTEDFQAFAKVMKPIIEVRHRFRYYIPDKEYPTMMRTSSYIATGCPR